MVNKRVSELITNYPNINKVHPIENDTIKDIRSICEQNDYQLAIAVYPTFKIAIGLYLANVRYRLGTGYRWYSFLFNIRHFQHRKYSLKHELEYNLDLLNELNCKRPQDISVSLKVESNTVENVKKKLAAMGIPSDRTFIIIHPVTLGSAKVWSQQNFIKLISLIINDSECHFNVFLTGTKEDQHDLNNILSKLGNNEKVFKIQDLSLNELASLIKMSNLFVSNSTGPIHIAAAVGTFTIGFYSPVTSERAERWAPYTKNKLIFTPASNSHREDVMNDIHPKDVFAFIKSYMLKQGI